MRVEIRRLLRKIGFTEKEAKFFSEKIVSALKKLGVTSLKTVGLVAQAVVVSLLHSWTLALLA